MKKIKLLFDIPYYQLNNNESSVSFVTKYNGKWEKTTTKNFILQINNLSKSLLALGIKPNDKIAIITDRTRTEWHIADMAMLQLGVQSIPIYASTSSTEMEFIFNHSEVKFCFVSNKDLLDKVNSFSDRIKTLEKIISFDVLEDCVSIDSCIKQGALLNTMHDVNAIKNKISGDDIATIVYTSGTTAMPKGALVTHKNILATLYDSFATVPEDVKIKKVLSLLPVSHIFERMMLYMYQHMGITIYFAESMETVANDMKYVKPQVISLVPRLLEKIHDKILEKGTGLTKIKKQLFNWALEIGYNYEPDGINGKSYERNLSIARKLVFKKWQEVFGGNIELIICGGSKLQTRLYKVFNAAGLYVMDGYGLTESAAVLSVNTRLKNGSRSGSVGKPIPCNHIIISKDGEILVKGTNITKGYFKDPVKTENAFINGYFKTGDLGRFDKDGFLYVTGRKKDIFKTSGGKYIAPIKIENILKESTLIEQVIVIGENERFPAAIIQPNFKWFVKKYPQLANTDISKSTIVKDVIEKEVTKTNETLGQWERIKKIELTPDEWTTEAGHLTPTLKIKRDIVKAKYYALYNSIYRPVNEIDF